MKPLKILLGIKKVQTSTAKERALNIARIDLGFKKSLEEMIVESAYQIKYLEAKIARLKAEDESGNADLIRRNERLLSTHRKGGISCFNSYKQRYIR